jgi:hypothetical protein
MRLQFIDLINQHPANKIETCKCLLFKIIFINLLQLNGLFLHTFNFHSTTLLFDRFIRMTQQPLRGEINIGKIDLGNRHFGLTLREAHVQQLLDDGSHFWCKAVVQLV